MSELLHFAEHTLQEVALLIMAVVYTLRLRWLFKFKGGRERQAPTGSPDTTPRKGIFYSLAVIGMPWTMESTRTKAFFYVQFIIFHIGVTLAILLSFIIPYAPSFLNSYSFIIPTFQVLIGAAFIVGCVRLVRRMTSVYVRSISSPDDYFSLILLTVWFAFTFFAVPNQYDQGEGMLLTYFFLTAFFLIYVPFSKISHYLYYPFARYWFGKTMGYRGVYPIRHSAKKGGVEYGK
jgi:nitrate reductase gamma subunit